MVRWKKLIGGFAKIVGAILFVVIVGFGVLIFLLNNRDVETNRYSEVKTSDGSYSLIIDVANPSMPYGAHTVKITIANISNEIILSGEYRLSNDGAIIDGKNIEFRWISNDSAEVCLRGEEQADVIVSIQVSKQRIAKKEEQCWNT